MPSLILIFLRDSIFCLQRVSLAFFQLLICKGMTNTMEDTNVPSSDICEVAQAVTEHGGNSDESGNAEQTSETRTDLVCFKCGMGSAAVLFFNINCQCVLCIKCLSPLAEKTQMKCGCNVSCESLWTRKSASVMAFVHPLFVNQIELKTKGADCFNVDKSELDVEKDFDAEGLKLLKQLKPFLPSSVSANSIPSKTTLPTDSSLQEKSGKERSSRSSVQVPINVIVGILNTSKGNNLTNPFLQNS